MNAMLGVKILEEKFSKSNGQIKVINAWGWGTYIQAGGLTQSGGIINAMWRQTLQKLKTRKIKRCLILGLGGGTVAGYVKKLWPEAETLGVDIDPVIVDLGKKYLGLNKYKIHVKIADALDFVKRVSAKSVPYDLIIVDLYNGDRFPGKFESASFLKAIPKLLSRDGIVIFNRLYYKDKKTDALNFQTKLEKVFKNVSTFLPTVNIMFFCKN
jgi:spermidine synthase